MTTAPTVTKIQKDKRMLTLSARRRSISKMKRAAHRAARRAVRRDVRQGNWDVRHAPRMTGWEVI